MTNTEKVECSVHGMLYGGRAMCGEVLVGGQFCGRNPGECQYQVGAKSLKDMTEADFNKAHGG